MNKKTNKNNSTHKNGQHTMTNNASDFLRRFWTVTVLLIPLLATSSLAVQHLGIPDFPYRSLVQLLLASAIFYFSLIFFRHARHEFAAKQFGMMTLVSLAIAAGFGFSVISTFLPQLHGEFFIEISTLIWVLLFGHYLEARSSAASGDALEEIAQLLPKKVHILEDGEEKEVLIELLSKNDIVRIKSGEKIPADGEIIDGEAVVDESHITGESKPVQKTTGDQVSAGSICTQGSMDIKLLRTGEDSTIGQMQSIVEKAQSTKPKSQALADRAARWLTLIAIIASLATLVTWSVFLNQTFVFAITLAITVLVITCPHALGLAIPAVTSIATTIASKKGIFIKDLSQLENVRKITTIVFDKTGTLTQGVFEVTEIHVLDKSEDHESLLRIATSLEQRSSHIIAASILKKAEKEKVGSEFMEMKNFQDIQGRGIQASHQGKTYAIGNRALLDDLRITVNNKESEVYTEATQKGKTTVFITKDSTVIGILALSDTLRPESTKAIQELHKLGIDTALITGDNENVASATANELRIRSYYSGVLPEDKYKYIKNLQEEGEKIMMIGDGVNDAPALAQADIGVAIGAGTDIASESGDIILTRSNPMDVVRLISLGKKAYTKMIQNLFWALGYNVIAIPAAAGVFISWGFILRPEIGAFLMSISSVIVVFNAFLLKKDAKSI